VVVKEGREVPNGNGDTAILNEYRAGWQQLVDAFPPRPQLLLPFHTFLPSHQSSPLFTISTPHLWISLLCQQLNFGQTLKFHVKKKIITNFN
jgi:hypothetical protein